MKTIEERQQYIKEKLKQMDQLTIYMQMHRAIRLLNYSTAVSKLVREQAQKEEVN